MPVTRSYSEYSKDDLIRELTDLQGQNENLKALYEKDLADRRLEEEKLVTPTKYLKSFSQYSIELADLESKNIYQFVVDKFKEIFNVRAVWISAYDEKKSELIIEASTASDDDNSIIVRHLGKVVHKFRTSVSNETYKMLMETGVSKQSSLHQLSFGQIPQAIGSVIEKLLGVGWFQGITLIDKGKLSGTLMIAGAEGQEELNSDILKVFAELTSNILRRKNTEEKLLASEEKFRKAFITSPDSININRIDDGMFVSINNGFTKIMGYTEEEVIGRTSFELNVWKNPEDRKLLIDRLKTSGEVVNLEASFISKSGAIKYGMMSAVVITLEGSSHILSITRDITDKKNSEIELQASENRYRELVELAVDGILLGKHDGTIIGANSFMLNLTGRSLDQLIGLDIKDLFPSDELVKNPLRFDQLIDGKTITCERQIIRPDGTMVPVEMHTKMMPDGKYQSIYHDITERKKTTEQLVKLNECFLKFVDDPLVNINLMVSIGGELLEATCSLYNRIEGEMLCSLGKWNTPPDYKSVDRPEGHICYDVINSEGDETVVLRDLQNSTYASSDPNVRAYNLSTYIGKAVKFGNKNVGSFCLVFHRDFIPDQNDIRIIEIISSAIGIEENRNHSRQALLESEVKLKSIFSAAPVGIGLVMNRVLMEVNDTFCIMLGYGKEELIGKSSEIIYSSGEEYDRVGREKYDQITTTGAGSIETVFKTKDGKLLNVILSSTPLDKNDYLKGVTFTVLDITSRKESEEALRESEEKFRSIAENLSDVIFITDNDGIIRYISPSVQNFGFSIDDCLGKFFGEFVGEEDFEKALQVFSNALNSINISVSVSLLFKRKDGSNFYAELTGSVFKVANNSSGILGLLRDITPRRILEAATIENEKRYRELFFNNPVPTYVFDTDSLEFIEVNDAVVNNYGYSREEFATMTLRNIRLKEEVPDLLKSIWELGDRAFHSTNMRHVKKDGTVFPVEITSHALPEKNGRKSRLALVVDITERRKVAEQMNFAREKAEASDRLKTTFLNNISHEVRTPLNGIIGFAEIINKPGLSEEEKNESISMLMQSSDRLLQTITSYMDISLLTSASMPVAMIEFNPATLLMSIYENCRSRCTQKGLKLYLDLPVDNEKLIINSDHEIIRKIMYHLLDNAIKFTDTGFIRFGYSSSEIEIKFFVTDTGIGIRKKSQGLIFEKFAKEELGPFRISEGSGLGLSIVNGMSELLGGSISVESETGSGSTFFLTLQLNPDQKKVTGDSPDVKLRNSSVPLKIIVAEDDLTNFFYFNAILSKEANTEILHAKNGREAVELFMANQDIDLILMDIKMPEVDGIEATRQIKRLKAEIPIIAVTAYAMPGDEEIVMAAGCNGYLSKPITKTRLMEKIAEFISI
jgi:PAS domain S-box-containing protein